MGLEAVVSPEAAAEELHAIARQVFRGEAAGHTLQPTALLGELWVRLLRSETTVFESTAAFRAWAATAMRHILVDHARRRRAAKRGGEARFEPLGAVGVGGGLDIVQLSDAIDRLKDEHPRSARVVEMRFFGGMGDAMIAERLGVSTRTVRSDWRLARTWLYLELGEGPGRRG
jgi:RNA polymerase sigma factor (TIGR02999 family)